jgi:redox-sensitive bicupin YhaK (pirin superfamily)
MEQAETELFQIWIMPNKQGVPARWKTVDFPAEGRDGKLVPMASGRGHDGAIPLYADGALFAGTLKAGQTFRQKLDGKPAYLVPAKGKIEVIGRDGKPVTANTRDGVAVVDESEIELRASEDSEIVLVETDTLN